MIDLEEALERLETIRGLVSSMADEVRAGATAETAKDANAALDEIEAIARIIVRECEQ